MSFRCGVPPPPTGYFSYGKSIQNHGSRAPPSRWSGALRCSANPAGLELAAAPLRQPGPCSVLSCASRQGQGRGRADIEHRHPDGGSATFTLPSITARCGKQRGLSEPPQAASSRAPRRARSTGQSEQGGDQGNGAGLLGTFCPTLNSPGANLNGAAGPQGRNTGMCFLKVPRPRGGPSINKIRCRRQHKAGIGGTPLSGLPPYTSLTPDA
jgi:hypothetical protein